jgi:Uma2 family endonuclease
MLAWSGNGDVAAQKPASPAPKNVYPFPMPAVALADTPIPRDRREPVPPLENGDQLNADEFLRRYSAMPHLKKAELIQGIVYMPPPVSFDHHAGPDSLLQTWAGWYAISTRGVRSGSNGTVRLSFSDVPQPDGCLLLLPDAGGQTRRDADGYVVGPPEFIFEVAASSASYDAGRKRETYRLAGVREYLLLRTRDHAVDWWHLEDGDYKLLPLNEDGTLRSQAFPGLWLNVKALLTGDGREMMRSLNEGLASEDHAKWEASLPAAP